MKIGIMQPYFFPYVGYFQLVYAVDKFIFYDDVNFIKGGWINRNYIQIGGQKKLVTIPLSASSPNKNINQIRIAGNCSKVLKTIKQSYSKAPFYKEAYAVVESVFNSISANTLISQFAALSVMVVSKYLNIKVEFEYSSEKYADTIDLGVAKRLIEICQRNNAETYINASGGRELYSKEIFKERNISIHFINTHLIEYNQEGNQFIPNLSIIDVLMFNSAENIHNLLNNYELE